MNALLNLQALDPQEQPRDGAESLRGVRAGQAVGVLPANAQLPEVRSSGAGRSSSEGEMAVRVELPFPPADLSPNRAKATGAYKPQEDAYLSENWKRATHEEMGWVLGRTEKSVRNRCWRLGLVDKSSEWSEADVAELVSAYCSAPHAKGIDLPGLALRLGRDKANVCRKARALGLTNQQRPMKPAEERRIRKPKFSTAEELSAFKSASAKAWIAQNGHPRGALGMKHTQDAKSRIAASNSAWWNSLTEAEKDEHVLKTAIGRRAAPPSTHLGRGSWKAGWREVGAQRCFFRSRWEANYARYLEWLRTLGQISSWEHEAHTFWFEGIKRGCTSYLPDFKVTNHGGTIEWHEVKGWMDARSKTTLARMAKYHPNEKLIVIQEKQYKEIQNKVSSLIPGWEQS